MPAVITTQARVQVPSVRPQNGVGLRERSAGSGAVPGAVESGRPDALTLEGFGWLGGDVGGMLKNITAAAEQAERAGDTPLQVSR